MDRIDVNPAVCSGKPIIRGTRIMIRNILGMVAGGYTVDKILEAYPELTAEDVAAALEYAARVVDEDQAHVSRGITLRCHQAARVANDRRENSRSTQPALRPSPR